ncbi:MAG: O-acetylhomoserine aminocarboxypropyltransferase/cysteine synthase [Spirochaetales bacterium]|nr:O-acetylhomoserine aminocarboxypropyltransferase/cysteine synthase [Spirochaetales bacterium]
MKFETLSLHGGQTVDETKSRGVPLYRTSAYLFDSAQHAQDLFSLKVLGNIYTRLGNPTQDVLEQRLALLEGGKASLALASGTNAVFYTMINICDGGDEIVASSGLYGGTYTMFDAILPQFGIKTRFADINDPESFRKKITDKTRVLYIESVGNPALDVADIEAFAKIADEYEIPLVVDSTFSSPYLLKPLEWGANIVIHSLTKWIGGHGTALGGIVVDGGTFDWSREKFSLYNRPDKGYHDLRFGHDLGELNSLAFILRMRTVPLRNLGGCISPDNSWMFLQGLETLALRMERHSRNALAVAEFLSGHERVDWVRYPGLKGDSQYEKAQRYLPRGAGGMVVFGIKGGREAGQKFIEALSLFSHVANVGDAKSLAIHPASTTHSQLSSDALDSAGIGEELVRLSIGIENIDDILEDLKNALAMS